MDAQGNQLYSDAALSPPPTKTKTAATTGVQTSIDLPTAEVYASCPFYACTTMPLGIQLSGRAPDS